MTTETGHPDCPFCAPQAVASTFAESGAFRAIYNIAPIVPGHSLVVPKAHLKSLMSLDEQSLCAFFAFARPVTTFLQNVFESPGFGWTIQNGEVAGQTVPHLHLHLIPRRAGDFPTPGDWYPALQRSEVSLLDHEARPRHSAEEMTEIVSHLRDAWSRFDGKPA